MPRTGRPSASTSEEREQVHALAGEGMSQRAIAERVFGHARYHGRVERILREGVVRSASGRRGRALTQAELDAFDASDVSVARELVARYERSLAESEEVPELVEIERLLRIKRQLEAAEMVARARAIAQGR